MKRFPSFLASGGALVLFVLAAVPCFAGEVAVLKNGFTIQHERREVVGELTRLYVTADGASYVDVPTADIDHYEEAPDPLPTDSPFAKKANPTPQGFPGRPKTDLTEVVNDASGRYRLDPDLVNSVIMAESGFNVRAVSPKGAQGLMQLMPGTASHLGVPNAFDPQANVEGGTRYLRELLERYNFDLVKALAAYNAGPQRVEQFGGVPPFHETQAYVARIVRDFNKKKIAQAKPGTVNPTQRAATAPKTGGSKTATGKSRTSPAKPATSARVARANAPSE